MADRKALSLFGFVLAGVTLAVCVVAGVVVATDVNARGLEPVRMASIPVSAR